MKLKQLTKAEEQVMQILWQLKEAVVKDIINQMPDPKPAYNTISTVVRVLEKKGFIDHKAYGITHVYFPIVSEKEYKSFAFNALFSSYFNNSYKNLVSFLIEEKGLNASEVEELREHLKKIKNKKK